MANRYKGKCDNCGETVPARQGILSKSGSRWIVTHIECGSTNHADDYRRAAPLVVKNSHGVYYSRGGYYRRPAGRCEDAPCCGCCD